MSEFTFFQILQLLGDRHTPHAYTDTGQLFFLGVIIISLMNYCIIHSYLGIASKIVEGKIAHSLHFRPIMRDVADVSAL